MPWHFWVMSVLLVIALGTAICACVVLYKLVRDIPG